MQMVSCTHRYVKQFYLLRHEMSESRQSTVEEMTNCSMTGLPLATKCIYS